MAIQDQLPKIGSLKSDGSLGIDIYGINKSPFFRPDYQEFKRRVYNTEKDCVSVLIGCSASDLWFVVEHQIRIRKEYLKKNSPSHLTNMEKVFVEIEDEELRAYMELSHLLVEMKSTLHDGEIMGNLTGHHSTSENDTSIEEPEDFFTHKTVYESTSFLGWMSENYPHA